jgi:uncharacterized membrane protein
MMPAWLIQVLLWFAAIGCGMMAGLYFAFSAFIMRALDSIPTAAGVGAMQAINRVILASLFMPLFWGTTLASLVLGVAGAMRWNEPGAVAMFAGGVTYVLGMFACTLWLNVPLNNMLDRTPPEADDAVATWIRYRRQWTWWNHVRTLASALASALFIAALG